MFEHFEYDLEINVIAAKSFTKSNLCLWQDCDFLGIDPSPSTPEALLNIDDHFVSTMLSYGALHNTSSDEVSGCKD